MKARIGPAIYIHGAEWGRTFRVFFLRFQIKRAQRRTFCVDGSYQHH